MPDAMELLREAANVHPSETARNAKIQVMKVLMANLLTENDATVKRMMEDIRLMASNAGSASGLLVMFALYSSIEVMRLCSAGLPGFNEINEACREVSADFAAFCHQNPKP